jgi:hypothetical protein
VNQPLAATKLPFQFVNHGGFSPIFRVARRNFAHVSVGHFFKNQLPTQHTALPGNGAGIKVQIQASDFGGGFSVFWRE